MVTRRLQRALPNWSHQARRCLRTVAALRGLQQQQRPKAKAGAVRGLAHPLPNGDDQGQPREWHEGSHGSGLVRHRHDWLAVSSHDHRRNCCGRSHDHIPHRQVCPHRAQLPHLQDAALLVGHRGPAPGRHSGWRRRRRSQPGVLHVDLQGVPAEPRVERHHLHCCPGRSSDRTPGLQRQRADRDVGFRRLPREARESQERLQEGQNHSQIPEGDGHAH
mmetsp:Transcript_145122/g.404348  ORF Transcript_145122/g.404348 Transcript_145122/m.404348 type:complete len:219 (+) Transcript_145122:2707-3363(+)